MPKIAGILNPAFKSGISAAGKPWSLMQIVADTGETANIFAPATIGDEIALKYNEQYKNFSAEKITPAKKQEMEIISKLDEILGILKAGRVGYAGQPSTPSQAPPNPGEASEVPIENYEGPF